MANNFPFPIVHAEHVIIRAFQHDTRRWRVNYLEICLMTALQHSFHFFSTYTIYLENNFVIHINFLITEVEDNKIISWSKVCKVTFNISSKKKWRRFFRKKLFFLQMMIKSILKWKLIWHDYASSVDAVEKSWCGDRAAKTLSKWRSLESSSLHHYVQSWFIRQWKSRGIAFLWLP